MLRLALKQNTTLLYTRDIPETKGFRKAEVGKVTKRHIQKSS